MQRSLTQLKACEVVTVGEASVNPILLTRIGRVLRAANARPFTREKFYPIKSAICQAYGLPDGFDVQHITYSCWGRYRQACDEHCDKCCGTGIYDHAYVQLKRWNLGGFVFHEPVGRIPWDEASKPGTTIEGKVEHLACRRSYIACGAIGRLFDLDYYWFVLRGLPHSRFGHYVKRIESVVRWVVSPPCYSVPSANRHLSAIPMFQLPRIGEVAF